MKRCVHCFGAYEDVFEVCPHCGGSKGCPAALREHLTPGTMLKQRYFIGNAAGAGGFGILYRAYDTTLQTCVAVKEFFPHSLAVRAADGLSVLPKESRCDAEFAYRKNQYIKEARFLSGFQAYPTVPSVTDYFEENGTAYIVMEYLNGRNLAENGKYLPLGTDFSVLAVAEAAATAALLHRKNMVHRDIAPDNLMVCTEGEKSRVILLDFGAAERIGERKKETDRILKAGYSSPELYAGERAGKISDVYSLGCTLYALLTGEKPERADIREKNRTEISGTAAPDGIPKKLGKIVRKATDLSPQKRYRDADAFLADLAKASPVAKEVRRRWQNNGIPQKTVVQTETPVSDLTETRGVTEAVPSRLLPGTELHGRYAVGLGVERCGALYRYKGTDRLLRCPVEICEFFPRGLCERWFDGVRVQKKGIDGAFDDARGRFRSLAEQYVSRDFGGVCEEYSDLFEENGTVYLIAYDSGAVPLSAQKRFCSGKKYREKDVRAVLAPVAAGISALAEKGTAHGNIAPETVCTGENGVVLRNPRALCTAYGAGEEAGRQKSADALPVTEPGEKNGVPDLQSDCYALGVLAYRLLTGKAPMQLRERIALSVSTGRDPMPPVAECARVGKKLAADIDAALQLRPGARDNILEAFSE